MGCIGTHGCVVHIVLHVQTLIHSLSLTLTSITDLINTSVMKDGKHCNLSDTCSFPCFFYSHVISLLLVMFKEDRMWNTQQMIIFRPVMLLIFHKNLLLECEMSVGSLGRLRRAGVGQMLERGVCHVTWQVLIVFNKTLSYCEQRQTERKWCGKQKTETMTESAVLRFGLLKSCSSVFVAVSSVWWWSLNGRSTEDWTSRIMCIISSPSSSSSSAL